MFHLTLMAGAEVRLKEADNIVITVWGGTEILLPTLAEKIKRLHRVKSEGRTTDAVTRRTNVITFQGATIFKLPTLGREVEELMQLRDASNLSPGELLKLWEEVIQIDDFDVLETFTVMGGAGEEKPSKKEELGDLERLTPIPSRTKPNIPHLASRISPVIHSYSYADSDCR